MASGTRIWTIGHGNASAAAFVGLLEAAGIETVVDVRRFPGSRRHPHFGRDEMVAWLAAAGRDYRWMEGLGGRRRVRTESPNVALRNRPFRAYADHMSSPEFVGAVDGLLDIAGASPSAVLCSESVWWRCHRRLLADHLVLIEEVDVAHVFHDGRITAHPITPGARRMGRQVVYDGA
jgi:uncharacterized protein (DUF488 family)